MRTLFKFELVDLKDGLLNSLSKALLIIMAQDTLFHRVSAYRRHQPDLKEEKCLISTNRWSFYFHFWERTGLSNGSWCWNCARRALCWCRICFVCPFFLSLYSLCQHSSFSLLQYVVTPSDRLSQNTLFFFAFRTLDQPLIALQYWGWSSSLVEKKDLGMEKGPGGDAVP